MTKNLSYFWVQGSDNENTYLFGSGGSDKVHMKNYDKTLFVSNWLIEEIVSIHEVARKMLLQHQTSLLTSSVRFECTTLKLIGEWCKFLHRVSSSIDVFVDQKQG